MQCLVVGFRIAFVGLAAFGIAAVAATSPGSVTASAAFDTTTAVIDRTYSCATGVVGGVRSVETRAHSGSRAGPQWARLPYAAIASGGLARTFLDNTAAENSLAWITAAKPSHRTTIDDERSAFSAQLGGTLGVNRERCVPVGKQLPLTSRGLVKRTVPIQAVAYDCEAPWRVLVRVRAVVDGGTALRERGEVFRATNAPARQARLAIGTQAGRVLAFAHVDDTGMARLFTARACTAD
jgi:hypothetical protein